MRSANASSSTETIWARRLLLFEAISSRCPTGRPPNPAWDGRLGACGIAMSESTESTEPTEPTEPPGVAGGRAGWRESTLWTARGAGSLQEFLRTETGSAAVLAGAIVLALVWANVDFGSYDDVWTTELSFRLGDSGVSHDLRTWINDGLMTFFFLVVGLEARREIDLGDLRERRRFLLPVVAGLLAML